jgi:L-ascorbate metabolism protein UlaG (beta-lactamase superfamily)
MATGLTWLGHGSWSIDAAGCRVVLDPFLDDSPVAPVKSGKIEADFILVSHGHYDHVADVEKIARRTGATIVASYEICEWFGKKGLTKTHAMNIGGGFGFPFGRVKMTIAHHTSMLPDGSNGGNPAGFLISLPEGNVYFACDTGLFYDMKLIGEAGLELAALPIGDNFTMGPEDALQAVKLLAPKRVVPVHRNTWPLIAQNAESWAQRVKNETTTVPVVLDPGGKIIL